MMSARGIMDRHGRVMGGMGLLLWLLAGCGQDTVGDPWMGQDPQWKRSHFATESPDAQLKARAAYNQIDR